MTVVVGLLVFGSELSKRDRAELHGEAEKASGVASSSHGVGGGRFLSLTCGLGSRAGAVELELSAEQVRAVVASVLTAMVWRSRKHVGNALVQRVRVISCPAYLVFSLPFLSDVPCSIRVRLRDSISCCLIADTVFFGILVKSKNLRQSWLGGCFG